jgi:hypothetical protein
LVHLLDGVVQLRGEAAATRNLRSVCSRASARGWERHRSSAA